MNEETWGGACLALGGSLVKAGVSIAPGLCIDILHALLQV